MGHKLSVHDLKAGYRTGSVERVTSSIPDATLRQGTITCLLGPNGAGKSTLLRTLAGFQKPLHGEISLDGKALCSYSRRELSMLLSIVMTDNSHISNLTVAEVAAMGRSPYTGFWGRLSHKDNDIVMRSLGLVGITELAGKKIDEISDGERQKVMIAKALAQETPFIILDEPTSFLYYPDKVQIMKLLHSMAHEMGKCVLLSTHAVEIALQIADCIWFIDEGKLITGTPLELCDNRISDLSYEKIIDCINAMRLVH
ncbi:MAG: ABC transporter ATP-binding protein [Bacteroidaceae bacterium]|nr:ABC transporter ATP-binding protein [Bacteroidaceae bacterium]